jgi:alpha-tubulin suppressor-like RCC1 family protein
VGSGTDTVTATDSLGVTATAAVTIHPALAISPTAITVAQTETQVFVGTGGVSPYTFSVSSGGAGGTTSAAGTYTAPSGGVGSDTIVITDALGNTASATASVVPALAISPKHLASSLCMGQTQYFTASGGVSPYTFTVQAGGGGGTVTSTGLFTAPMNASSDVVVVSDSIGNVVDTLAITTSGSYCLASNDFVFLENQTFTFAPVGATGSNTFSSSTGTLNSSTGVFSAPLITSFGAVTIVDSGSHSVSAFVNTIAPVQISASKTGSFNCALSNAGNVYCWGYGSSGQLGNGAFTATQKTPVEVAGVNNSGVLSNIVNISTGTDHACAVSSAGNVYCWGYNANGQLGNGSSGNTFTPVEVVDPAGGSFLSDIVTVSAGSAHTCALSLFGNVYCWGDNTFGELGTGSRQSSSTPVEVVDSTGLTALQGVINIGVGSNYSCAVVQASSPTASTGNVYCWGENSYGQLGNGSVVPAGQAVPTEVMDPTGSVALTQIQTLAVAPYATCALSNQGDVFCWGLAGLGQLGDATTNGNQGTSQTGYVTVKDVGGSGNLSGIVDIAGGFFQMCAVKFNGNVYCWGANYNYQLGTGDTTNWNTPVQVCASGATGSNCGGSYLSATAVAGGSQSTCAVTSGGNVYCWGYNTNGQIGNNSTTTAQTPAEVVGVGGAGVLSGI